MKPSSEISLVRGLTLIPATAIVIGNIIGTGIFLKTRVMTCNVGTPGKVLAVWVVAGLLSLAGALTYAEIAAMMPRAGGEYVFLREAFGPSLGFLYGWMQFFVARAGGVAAISIGFAIFLNNLVANSLSQTIFSHNLLGWQFTFTRLQLVALGALAFVTLINCAAVIVSGRIATFLTAVKILAVVGIGVGAFFYAHGDWSHLVLSNVGGACTGVDMTARSGLTGFGAAMLGALWAYNGWNDLTFVSGEVKNPHRNLPLALIGGTSVVIVLYLFINFAYFFVLTPTEIANVPAESSVAIEVALKFLGPIAISIIVAALMASSLGTLHIGMLVSARLPYAMSHDRLFFRRLARLNPRTHVPVMALILQALWTSILIVTGSFDFLADYAIFALWIFYGLTGATVFVFRKKMPDAERPYRVWGYPIVPALFLLVTAWLLVNTLWTTPKQSFSGLILILLGLPVYFYWSRRKISQK